MSKQMTPPRQRMIEDMTIRNMSPFGREVAEAGHSHSVGKSPIDGCLDEVGRNVLARA